MQILLGEKKDHVRLGDMGYGDCFFYERYLYMKIRLKCSELNCKKPHDRSAALNLKSGTMRLLKKTERVSRANAVVHLDVASFAFLDHESDC